MAMRIESDSMGQMEIPQDAMYVASTRRAEINFPISDRRLPPSFIHALCLIKLGAAMANKDLGLLEADRADAIIKAAQEILQGAFSDQFVVDVFQTGSGTSTNMNVNEVIANRACQLMGGNKGEKSLVHPNDHVNAGMSSNDAIPSAMHISVRVEIVERLLQALGRLRATFESHGQKFWNVIKTGRTHLQDATPIRLGQSFVGYAGQIERAIERLEIAADRLGPLALGGTAVGTGINCPPGFVQRVLELVSQRTGLVFSETTNHFQAQSTIDEIVSTSGALKSLAVSLIKIANDIRFLSSGPRAGYGEIAIPEVQPGSSIMPGKVNPVIAESLIMVCAQVIGHDATIALCGQSGNFELNVMLPLAAFDMLDSIDLLTAAVTNFDERCVRGIQATQKGPQSIEQGLALATALVPLIGYDKAAACAHDASLSGKTVREVAMTNYGLSADVLKKALDPESMV